MATIRQAAKLLGRKLCGNIPNITGVSLRRSPKASELLLYVNIDSDSLEVAGNIIAEVGDYAFEGYEIHLMICGTPRFAKKSKKF